jgi:hypothetical protein
MTTGLIRMILGAAGGIYAVLTVGFVGHMAWAVALWPWPDTPLSYIFIGSITGAFAIGALWSAATGRVRAVGGSLFGLTLIYGSIAVCLAFASLPEGVSARPHAAVAAATALASAILLRLVARQPVQPTAPLETIVRQSSLIFALALAGAGLALLARMPHVFPWPLSPASSTVFGLTFLGLSLIYGQVWLSGSRDAAVITMAGFLVYDLILLPPFLGHFAKVPPEKLLSLSVYTAVLIYSALLAIWFLFWRGALWRRAA